MNVLTAATRRPLSVFSTARTILCINSVAAAPTASTWLHPAGGRLRGMELTAAEIRVLGCLVEKAATTPDLYPLTTNALVSACNQKSSRDPVVAYSSREVTEAMMELRPAGLARTVTGSGRTEKHRHVLDEAWGLDPHQLAVLAVLALRGPQTPGELRQRTERYVSFEGLDDVQVALDALAARDEPLVVDLGRGPGQSQNRWTHLLAGDVAVDGPGGSSQAPPAPATTPAGSTRSVLEARVSALEARLARLEASLGLDSGGDPAGTGAEDETEGASAVGIGRPMSE